ncbi:MAG: prolipoprotein diacylglyceryl transferase, partial [Alphaproteobacteria bacterium]|nr:prolipoprotein diacylglyceryl transferase [Alphaproteobacteria bacterium]
MAITLNPISPVAFSVLGLDVRWYALAYVAAFVIGYWVFKRLMSGADSMIKLDKRQLDDLLTAVIIGVILGGRMGYVLFYDLGYFIAH